MDAYRVILTKRDTRAFTDEPVGDGDLDRILQAGRMAGSAKNLQPCRFVVLTERGRKEELAACGQFSVWIPEAPLVIAVVLPADGREFDAGRTAQNMMLAAHAMGLASCPVTMHDNDAARVVLGAPEGHKVSIVLAIGHPDEANPSPLRGPRVALEELVHTQRWRE